MHEGLGEAIERQRVALDLDARGRGLVADKASEPELGREAVHEGPEAHALHRAFNQQLAPHTSLNEHTNIS